MPDYIDNMIDIRKEKRETQQQLSKAIGWSRPQIARYETRKSTPSIDYLYAFCQHYEISADWILQLPRYRR